MLAPGAPYVMVTSASPRSRLPALRAPRRGGAWSRILVYEVRGGAVWRLACMLPLRACGACCSVPGTIPYSVCVVLLWLA